MGLSDEHREELQREAHVQTSTKSGLPDLNAALAWALSTSDTRYNGEPTTIAFQHVLGTSDDSSDWESYWEVAITGEVE